MLETPCITLRQNTEWIETLCEDRNILVGTESQAVVRAIKDWVSNDKEIKPVFGSGGASNIILNAIKETLHADRS